MGVPYFRRGAEVAAENYMAIFCFHICFSEFIIKLLARVPSFQNREMNGNWPGRCFNSSQAKFPLHIQVDREK